MIYTTRPLEETAAGRKKETKEYEMESPLVEVLHSDLKRDLSLHGRAEKKGNQTMIDGPLFDKYQFLSPGMWFTPSFSASEIRGEMVVKMIADAW